MSCHLRPKHLMRIKVLEAVRVTATEQRCRIHRFINTDKCGMKGWGARNIPRGTRVTSDRALPKGSQSRNDSLPQLLDWVIHAKKEKVGFRGPPPTKNLRSLSTVRTPSLTIWPRGTSVDEGGWRMCRAPSSGPWPSLDGCPLHNWAQGWFTWFPFNAWYLNVKSAFSCDLKYLNYI